MKTSENSVRHILHFKMYLLLLQYGNPPEKKKQAYFLGRELKCLLFYRNHKTFSIFITLPQKSLRM